jgi:hypothetical protein
MWAARPADGPLAFALTKSLGEHMTSPLDTAEAFSARVVALVRQAHPDELAGEGGP